MAQKRTSNAFTTLRKYGEGFINMPTWHIGGVVQGTWVSACNPPYDMWNVETYNTSNTLNDAMFYLIYLDAGTYSCRIMGSYGPNRAISAIYMDGVQIGTNSDWYNPVYGYNYTYSYTSIAVSTPGLKQIKIKVVSSSVAFYYVAINQFSMWRTA